MMTEHSGEVFDLGYQHYSGPREGRMRARKALWTDGMRTALGLGRGPGAKVLTGVLFISAILPAVIMSLIASAAGAEENIPGHADYSRFLSVVLLVFSAIRAPDLLCPDRRDGVIYLYLVRPLTTTDYVVGRWFAFFSVSVALVCSGQLILFFGLALAADGPLSYFRDNWQDIPRFLGAALVVAAFTTTLPLAVSAFTTRKAFAAAFVIGLYFISSPLAAILTTCDPGDLPPVGSPGYERALEECEPQTGAAGKWLALIDMGQVPGHLSDLIMDDESMLFENVPRQVGKLPTGIPVLWYVIMTAGPGYLLWQRYRRLRA